MAFVVMGTMFAFIAGSYLQQLAHQRRAGLGKTIAYFSDNKKITQKDRAIAIRELEILQTIRADALLRVQDLSGIFLAELLFSERRFSPQLIRRLKRIISTNQCPISDKQINDVYRRSMPPYMYWLLLKNEAQNAGIAVTNHEVGTLLAKVIPQLFPGSSYSQMLGMLVEKRRISEQETLTTFGKLLAVLKYAGIICSNEAVTNPQIMRNTSLEQEKIDAEFVKFDSAVFADTQKQPDPEQISTHFNKYKKFFSGEISEQNPYGFGYKLADRVRLEYIAVKLDDVASTISAPTQEQMQEYYQRHRQQFTEKLRSDPNDPNSPLVERTRSYSEVVDTVERQLHQSKINSKAEMILQEAKTLTELDLENTDSDIANISTEQLQQMAGDYKTTAEQLGEKYKIKVYSGRTSLLSPADIWEDEYLAMLYVRGYGFSEVALAKIIFAVDPLDISELGPFDVPKPRMYESIGTVKDRRARFASIVRITEAEKSCEPGGIDQVFSKSSLNLDENQEQSAQNSYSIKEEVVEDIQKLVAMDTTKSKAEEFAELAAENGWENTIDKFNKLYARQNEDNQGNLTEFRLENLTNLQRLSSMTLEALSAQIAGNPGAQQVVNDAQRRARFIDKLHSLVPQDANSLDSGPQVFEFKPYMSYYCVKTLSVNRLEKKKYEEIKVLRVHKEDIAQSQSLAVIHFNPENIVKRTNYRPVRQQDEPTDSNTPAAQSKGES